MPSILDKIVAAKRVELPRPNDSRPWPTWASVPTARPDGGHPHGDGRREARIGNLTVTTAPPAAAPAQESATEFDALTNPLWMVRVDAELVWCFQGSDHVANLGHTGCPYAVISGRFNLRTCEKPPFTHGAGGERPSQAGQLPGVGGWGFNPPSPLWGKRERGREEKGNLKRTPPPTLARL